VRVGTILFGGAGASEVSLLATAEARTLYAPLGSSIISPDDVSSCLSSASSLPISSWCSRPVYVHGYWLVVPGLWHGAGIVRGLSEALMTLLWVVRVLCEPGPWLGIRRTETALLPVSLKRGPSEVVLGSAVHSSYDSLQCSDTDGFCFDLVICVHGGIFKDFLANAVS
jgi:hypothetical protein